MQSFYIAKKHCIHFIALFYAYLKFIRDGVLHAGSRLVRRSRFGANPIRSGRFGANPIRYGRFGTNPIRRGHFGANPIRRGRLG
ncbi:hypothetical protein SK128_009647, partial [Halocaridina rubra]